MTVFVPREPPEPEPELPKAAPKRDETYVTSPSVAKLKELGVPRELEPDGRALGGTLRLKKQSDLGSRDTLRLPMVARARWAWVAIALLGVAIVLLWRVSVAQSTGDPGASVASAKPTTMATAPITTGVETSERTAVPPLTTVAVATSVRIETAALPSQVPPAPAPEPKGPKQRIREQPSAQPAPQGPEPGLPPTSEPLRAAPPVPSAPASTAATPPPHKSSWFKR